MSIFILCYSSKKITVRIFFEIIKDNFLEYKKNSRVNQFSSNYSRFCESRNDEFIKMKKKKKKIIIR